MTILEKANKIKEFCNYTNDDNCKKCDLNNGCSCCILSIDAPVCFCRTEKDIHILTPATEEVREVVEYANDINEHCYKQDCLTCEYNHEKSARKRAEGYYYCEVRKTLPKHFAIAKTMDLILGGK